MIGLNPHRIRQELTTCLGVPIQMALGPEDDNEQLISFWYERERLGISFIRDMFTVGYHLTERTPLFDNGMVDRILKRASERVDQAD